MEDRIGDKKSPRGYLTVGADRGSGIVNLVVGFHSETQFVELTIDECRALVKYIQDAVDKAAWKAE